MAAVADERSGGARERSPSATNEGWERLATNLRVQSALPGVLDVLSDLTVVVFKGALLTERVYGDLRLRASADNDLFVPASEAPVALERLLARGLRPLPGIDPRAALNEAGQVALWPNGDVNQVSLDLHQRPFSLPYFDVPESLVLGHLEETTFLGRPVLTFDRPLTLCHLVAHFVQHHLDRDHLPLIAAATRAFALDARELTALATQTGTLEAMDYALSVAAERGLLERGARWQTRRARQVRRLWPSERERPPREVLRKALSLYLASPRNFARGVAGSVWLRPDDLRSRYGNGPRLLLSFRHVMRVIRGD